MSFPENLTAILASVLNELPFNSVKYSLGLAAQGRINIASTTGNKVALAKKICLGKIGLDQLLWMTPVQREQRCFPWLLPHMPCPVYVTHPWLRGIT